MPKATPGLLCFNSGELSPELEGRTDLAKYPTGALKMENIIPMIQGPMRRRPGTIFVEPIRDSSKRGWLTPFSFNVGQSYMLEWGDHALRFYTNRGQVVTLSQIWNATLGGTTADGALTWTNQGRGMWASGAVRSLNDCIIDINGNIQRCSTAGTSQLAPYPGFSAVVGNITLDGSAIWECMGVPQWAANTTFTAPAVIYTAVGIQLLTGGSGGMSGAGNTGTPYEIPTPYGYADLTDAQGICQLIFDQSADVVYFTHRSQTFQTYKLSRFGPTDWTIGPVNFIGGPFASENSGTNPIVFASATTGLGITLTASSDIFDNLLMNSYFQLTQQTIRDVKAWEAGQGGVHKGDLFRYNGTTYEAVDGAGTAPWTMGTTPPTHITGTAYDGGGGVGVVWLFRDPGYGMVVLRNRGTNPTGSVVNITGITQANPAVVTTDNPTPANNGDLVFITGVVGMTDINDEFYRVSGKSGNTFALQQDVTPTVSNPTPSPTNLDSTTYDAYTSGGTVSNNLWTCTADVIVQTQSGTVNRLPKTVTSSNNATSLWAVAEWNNRDGYPGAVRFYRGRLAFARGGSVDISVAQDFENFSALTPNAQITADMAIQVTLPIEDAIQWLAVGRVLVAGTASTEHVVAEADQSQALGPANIASKPETHYGSRGIQAVVIGNDLVFVQTSGLKVWAIKYDFMQDIYEGAELTKFANHIALGTNKQNGIIASAYQKEPDSVLWCARADGQLIGLNFRMEDDERVIGWHRHPMTNGIVESIACIPSPDGSQDDLWMIVNRTIEGVTQRYVEYMSPHFLTGGNQETDAHYADCCSILAGPIALGTPISGLNYLAGQTVKVLADGATHPDCVVSTGGQITLQRAVATSVTIGLPQTAKYTSMPIEAGSMSGTAQGKLGRIIGVNIRFLNSLGGQIGRDGQQMDTVELREPSTPMDQPVPLFSGIWPVGKPKAYPDGYWQERKLSYQNSDPLPFTITAIYPTLEANDR